MEKVLFDSVFSMPFSDCEISFASNPLLPVLVVDIMNMKPPRISNFSQGELPVNMTWQTEKFAILVRPSDLDGWSWSSSRSW